jgi:uncharacterized membrane protein YbhN (UPF0104 family)
VVLRRPGAVDLTTSSTHVAATPPIDTVAVQPKRGVRLFQQTGDQPRARRATDVILLVLSSVGLVLVGIVAVPQPGFSEALSELLTAMPGALTGIWQILADLPLYWGVLVLVLALVRRHLTVARDMVLAAVAAFAIWLIVARLAQGTWPEISSIFGAIEPPEQFPLARLGIAAALTITASPHLVRPARRFGHLIIIAGALAPIALGGGSMLGVIAALLAASAAAAATHLVLGSSAGRPTLADVRYALADMGVDAAVLGVADRQDAGQFAVAARSTDGAELIVKLYGRDAYDSALVNTVWRTIWLRQAGAPVGIGRLRQVEHEALLTLLAAESGTPTDTVVTAGRTTTDDAVLVLRRSGRQLVADDRLDAVEYPGPAFVGEEARHTVTEMWAVLRTLHDSGISHGQLDEHRFIVVDDRVGLSDFRGAGVAATPAQFSNDEAQLFIATLGLVGKAAALEGLVASRSVDDIERLLPYLQPSALTAAQRRLTKLLDVDLDELRTEVAEATGVEAPPLIRMRRFTLGAVVRVGLPGLALVMLASALAGFDFSELVESLQNANWWLVGLAFVISQLPRVAQSVSTLGAAPIPLPLGPVYGLQLAISYVNLAIPTAASRVAVNIRFFQRQGVSPTAAVTTGALDGFSGFVVQAVLLVGILVFTPLSFDLDLESPPSSALRIVGIVAVAVVVAIVVVAVVPRLRNAVVQRVRMFGGEALTVLRGLRSPRRFLMLFGGNLAAEVLFALGLSTFVLAMGGTIGLGEALLINITVSLFAGLLPVPGGMGVTEAGLIMGLTAFGVPEETAFAAVMLSRLSTFYLPPIWGYFAMNWLERRRYL